MHIIHIKLYNILCIFIICGTHEDYRLIYDVIVDTHSHILNNNGHPINLNFSGTINFTY